MRKSWLVLMGCSLLLLAAVGCDEDECLSCPDPVVTPLGHTVGNVTLTPNATALQLEVFGRGAVAPSLDSVKVGDSLASYLNWDMVDRTPYAGAHWLINFVETGDGSAYMYDHGDVATLRAWGSGRSGSLQVKILDPSMAIANITEPAPLADTIAPGVADTIYWNTIEHVDYYAIMIPWLISEGGTTRWTFTYHYATDTSFIVTGAMQPDSALRYDIVVTPFNGPNPRTGQTNWSGTLMGGTVTSVGLYDVTSVILVRLIQLSPGMALSTPAVDRPEFSPEEMVARVYETYRQ